MGNFIEEMNNAWIRGTAYNEAGYREKYAMDHCTNVEKKEVNGRVLLVFRYGADDEYQDANGATYDVDARRWVN